MRRPFYMDSTRAKEFGVIDKVICWSESPLRFFILGIQTHLIFIQFDMGKTLNYASINQQQLVVQILWRGQEQIMADVAAPEDWDKNAGIKAFDAI